LIQWVLAVVPLVRGSCGYRLIDSGGCRSKGLVAVGPVAPRAVVRGSCGCRSNDSVWVQWLQELSFVAVWLSFVDPVAVVPMTRWLLVQWLQELSFVAVWLSFMAPVACGCCSNDSVAIGPVAPGAVVRGCVAIVRSTPVTVVPVSVARSSGSPSSICHSQQRHCQSCGSRTAVCHPQLQQFL